MPIVISGEIDLDPSAREKALLDAQPLIEAALAEKGCVHYAWSADPVLAGRVHVFEEWDTEEDLAVHLGPLAIQFSRGLGFRGRNGGLELAGAHIPRLGPDPVGLGLRVVDDALGIDPAVNAVM